MDELIDIVDLKGKPTGNACLKSFAHKNGILHASIHVWFYTKNQQILIQKRKETKDVYPNLWDVSVAGHIGSGETPLLSALRETEEEIGHKISNKELTFLRIWEDKHHHANGIIDHEIHYLYIAELQTDISKLSIQEEEVSAIKLISLNEFENTYANSNVFVPHPTAYYQYIINTLKTRF